MDGLSPGGHVHVARAPTQKGTAASTQASLEPPPQPPPGHHRLALPDFDIYLQGLEQSVCFLYGVVPATLCVLAGFLQWAGSRFVRLHCMPSGTTEGRGAVPVLGHSERRAGERPGLRWEAGALLPAGVRGGWLCPGTCVGAASASLARQVSWWRWGSHHNARARFCGSTPLPARCCSLNFP